MRRPWLWTAAAAVMLVAVEMAARHAAHPVHPWHAVPAFDLAFGIVGCAVIVLASKALGHAALQKRDSYYGDEE